MFDKSLIHLQVALNCSKRHSNARVQLKQIFQYFFIYAFWEFIDGDPLSISITARLNFVICASVPSNICPSGIWSI